MIWVYKFNQDLTVLPHWNDGECKGNQTHIALFQVSELLSFTQISDQQWPVYNCASIQLGQHFIRSNWGSHPTTSHLQEKIRLVDHRVTILCVLFEIQDSIIIICILSILSYSFIFYPFLYTIVKKIGFHLEDSSSDPMGTHPDM